MAELSHFNFKFCYSLNINCKNKQNLAAFQNTNQDKTFFRAKEATN